MPERNDDDETERSRRPLISKIGRKNQLTRRPREDRDEIDERELDQVAGGRIYKIDLDL